jgi:hypothetical protein
MSIVQVNDTCHVGTLFCHINTGNESKAEEFVFVKMAQSHYQVLIDLRKKQLEWACDLVTRYCNQREEAFIRSDRATPEVINALFQIRSKILKTNSWFLFSQAFQTNIDSINTLLPSEQSRFARWRYIMAQLNRTTYADFKSLAPTLENKH